MIDRCSSRRATSTLTTIDLHNVPDADLFASTLATDESAALVHVPPVVHQILVADQPVDQIGRQLDEDAEIGHAGDDAVELVADVL